MNSNWRSKAKNDFSKDFSRKYLYGIAKPEIGDDSLFCRRKLSIAYHEYFAAIAAIDHFKQEEVVGNVVALFLSKTLNKFLRLPGSYASCNVTGTKISKGIIVGLDIRIFFKCVFIL